METVGHLIKHWRGVRRKSQLALAVQAGVSARHVGFIEVGRATPSREMLMLLAGALDVPLRERNALLLAAGYAPVYRETGLDAPEMEHARQAVALILEHQEPYPAVVMDRHWNILTSNAAAQRFFSRLLPPAAAASAPNIVRLMFDPGPAPLRGQLGERGGSARAAHPSRGAGRRARRGDRAPAGRGTGISGPAAAVALARPAGPVPESLPGPAVPQGGPGHGLLFDGDHAGHAAGRDAAGDPHRVLLPGQRPHGGGRTSGAAG
jgi:transcriptional regulator with XRE-family HTH domain